jgi:hypothetical protein
MPVQYLFLKTETKPIFPVLLTSLFRKLKFLVSMVNFCPPPQPPNVISQATPMCTGKTYVRYGNISFPFASENIVHHLHRATYSRKRRKRLDENHTHTIFQMIVSSEIIIILVAVSPEGMRGHRILSRKTQHHCCPFDKHSEQETVQWLRRSVTDFRRS